MNMPMTKRAGLLLLTAMSATMLAAGCNKAPQMSPTTTSTPAGNVSDADVTEHVKMALQQNDRLKGFNISVSTIKGDVRLNGVLDNQAQIDEAIRIARTSEGAHTIHDELTLKK
jgi:hyperosmotically inducible protein